MIRNLVAERNHLGPWPRAADLFTLKSSHADQNRWFAFLDQRDVSFDNHTAERAVGPAGKA